MDISVNGVFRGAAKMLGLAKGRADAEVEAALERRLFRGRAEQTYRGARRNAWRRDHSLNQWRTAPYRPQLHNTTRQVPVLDKNTGLPAHDKKTGKPIMETVPFVAVTLLHASAL